MSGTSKRTVLVDGVEVDTTAIPKAEIGWLGKLGGRKFIMAIAAVIALILQQKFNIPPETVYAIAGIVATFILGQSYSEAKTGGATSTTTPVTDPVEVSRIDHATEIIRNDTAKIEAKATVTAAAIDSGSMAKEDIADIVGKMM